jgi:hypothetical protein
VAWTTPFTATAGVVLTAAIWNASVRDDVNADHAVLSGTAQAFGTVFYPTTDTGYHLDLVSGDPQAIWDTSDYMWYLRSTNVWTIVIGGNSVITIDANGKITGKGFYSSGEVAITTGSNANFAHGLGARPRVVSGFSSATSGTEDSKTNAMVPDEAPHAACVGIRTADLTNLNVLNNIATTRYCHVYAQR